MKISSSYLTLKVPQDTQQKVINVKTIGKRNAQSDKNATTTAAPSYLRLAEVTVLRNQFCLLVLLEYVERRDRQEVVLVRPPRASGPHACSTQPIRSLKTRLKPGKQPVREQVQK